jgi:F-type H+-transporting ATPase subunit gamma
MFSKAINTKFALNQISKKNFAVNEKALKNRIKSVSSIAKITKAMKMVSSSKMKAELARLNAGRHFGYESIDKIFISDVYMQRKNQNYSSGNRVLYVPFTSDKGLCGGINTGIVREIRTILGKNQYRNQCGLYVVGDKGCGAFSRPFQDILKRGIHDLATPINYSTASSIAHDIGEHGKNFDKIVLIYNKYKSAISTEIIKNELMPRHKFLDLMSFSKTYNQKLPDKASSNPALYDLYLASNVYHAILNNLASEQSARMNAMENASKNAREIVEKLKLDYNKARQARITMELVEIISGASAV